MTKDDASPLLAEAAPYPNPQHTRSYFLSSAERKHLITLSPESSVSPSLLEFSQQQKKALLFHVSLIKKKKKKPKLSGLHFLLQCPIHFSVVFLSKVPLRSCLCSVLVSFSLPALVTVASRHLLSPVDLDSLA